MFDLKTLRRFVSDYRQYQDLRHRLKASADRVRSLAKHAITLMRQDKYHDAEQLLAEAERVLKSVHTLMKRQPLLATEGFFREALEEYAEAKAYHSFLTGERLTIPLFIPLDTDEALGGVCDFTGELVRKAMSIADEEHLKEIESYVRMTQRVVDELSHVSFSGKLREKYDDLERNLVKLERIVYEVRMARGATLSSE